MITQTSPAVEAGEDTLARMFSRLLAARRFFQYDATLKELQLSASTNHVLIAYYKSHRDALARELGLSEVSTR